MFAAYVTYLLTALGAALGLIAPFYGLLVYVALSVLRPTDLWDVSAGNYSRVVAIAVIVGWVLNGCGNLRFDRAAPIFWLLCAYLVWSAVSAFAASHQAEAWNAVETRLKIIVPVMIGFTLIYSTSQLKQFAWVLVLSQSIIAVAGHVSIHLLHAENWLLTQGLGGFDNNDTAAGMVLISGVAFGLGLSEPMRWSNWLALCCSGLLANAAILSYSRGALLGLLTVAVCVVAAIHREPKYRWILLLAVLGAIRITGPYAQERFLQIFDRGRDTSADSSAEKRTQYWKQGWVWMQEHPVFGIGPNNFQKMTMPYFGEERAAHSLWVSTGAELGFPGLAMLAGLFALLLKEAWNLRKIPSLPGTQWHRDAGRMALFGLPGFMVAATFLSISGLEQVYFVFLLVGGSIMLASREASTIQTTYAHADEVATQRRGGSEPYALS